MNLSLALIAVTAVMAASGSPGDATEIQQQSRPTPPGRAQPAAVEPQAQPPRVIRSGGPSPKHHRFLSRRALYVSRVSLGGGWRTAPAESETPGTFALEVFPLGVEVGFGRVSRTALLLECGYTYATPSDHFLSLGMGAVYRWFGPAPFDAKNRGRPAGDFTVGLVPHALVGSVAGHRALGVRTTAFFNFFVYGLSLSHQVLLTRRRVVHQVHAGFNLYYRLGGS